ncbi:MAG TPA: DUF6259 domain-containing protein [Candidatus Hydrogenedentes bacterium]|nr:DUF6259 domain-containing protein [Candidatus Hydrogenedentota bacterium]HOL77420.1 DUF6259 domain-containing protein [Candidatus Hydrogenedentota bacterium]HPO84563.1 DUF6259 domain-containing protein [Candidatus Hydrogenedentota bacterium]
MLKLENESFHLGFHAENGALCCVENLLTSDQYLKGPSSHHMPFRIYSDLTKEFEININDKFQLVFEDPLIITKNHFSPGTACFSSVQLENALALQYVMNGLIAGVYVELGDGPCVSNWYLRVTNTGTVSRDFLVSFPYFNGVVLGSDTENNLATAMDMGGLVVPAWERPGGVLGESNQFSMQWHAVWDPHCKSAMGLIFRDADVKPKRLVLRKEDASIDLQYFPPVNLSPGESVDFPSFHLLVYAGDWRPAARAYRAWYRQVYPHVEPPEWFRLSDGNVGVHFKKRSAETPPTYSGGQYVMGSFAELPAFHLRRPVDNSEYAFFCAGSMYQDATGFSPHTDGENIIREDLGGAEGLRAGIAGLHRLGFHATLYVEGYLMHKDCGLARAGKGERWAVMHKDGTIIGPYSEQGFYHMCPGCEEWQDHLAQMVKRLLRETHADGIRLDSLGFYYLPCYNPEHRHRDPFGYNEWIKQLLAKVRQAAVAVKPDVLLLTEGPADWFGQWFHGALTARCPRELSLMRIAVEPFRPYVYASGALWGALSGFAGGGCDSPDITHIDWNWVCARYTAHSALVWGDVEDKDPEASDPEIVTRCFKGDGYWALVAARPACQEPIWPRGTGISEKHRLYTVTLSGLAPVIENAVLCDVEKLNWCALDLQRKGNDLQLQLSSNWALVILREFCGPGIVCFDSLPALHPGESVMISPRLLTTLPSRFQLELDAPGLQVRRKDAQGISEFKLHVPSDALSGHYKVVLKGEGVLGTKRFLSVDAG